MTSTRRCHCLGEAAFADREILTGILYGDEPVGPPPAGGLDCRTALERAIRPALRRAPCLVGFSGGRDSSALLAVAVALARREGLAAPIPATLEFAVQATIETSWQERLLGHLGLRDWLRLPVGDQLDLVGPVAARGLRRHGLLYPANAHFVVPLAHAAAGGSLLIGYGGDDVFGSWPWHDISAVMARRRQPQRDDLRRALHWMAPRGVRAEVLRRRDPVCSLPWIREPFRRRASLGLARELSRTPRTWAPRIRFQGRWRTWRTTLRSVASLGLDERCLVTAPFMDPDFLEAVASEGGRWGWGDRTATMRALFGDVLPDEVLSRRTKAEFSGPLFGTHTRAFAHAWDGRLDIDPATVDAGVLRAVWSTAQPHFLSSLLLQSAWLTHDAGARSGAGSPGQDAP